ncbi:hypothetical protein BS329_04110 [Amycolatopsis coloradensis]|uniref:Copper chaperone PCu(A)C n=1 Tax=Amycolatopsis coloradensis TaxID=76021 RepID=A0A1R0L1N7_9PSEU|nr:hypothetical protein [Amycolatopsis coloradensis]OLZ55729.1 hypothetical protein BS329_04110 [Amycolatopsis coloradensis]
MRLQNRRVFGASVLALGAALVLAGCGAGQITQTDSQQPAVNGTYAQAKDLVLRNAALQFPEEGQAYPAGAAVPLSLTIVNQGKQDDELVSVSSEAATGDAKISGAKVIVSTHALVIGPSDAVESTKEVAPTSAASSAPSSSGAPSSSVAPSSSESGAPSSSVAGTVTPSAGPEQSAEVGKATVVLQGLKQPVWAGQTIKVTFVFKNSGSITLDLPVAAPSHPGSRAPAPEKEAKGGGH